VPGRRAAKSLQQQEATLARTLPSQVTAIHGFMEGSDQGDQQKELVVKSVVMQQLRSWSCIRSNAGGGGWSVAHRGLWKQLTDQR